MDNQNDQGCKAKDRRYHPEPISPMLFQVIIEPSCKGFHCVGQSVDPSGQKTDLLEYRTFGRLLFHKGYVT